MSTLRMTRRRFGVALAATAATCMAPPTPAQAWPARPIRVIVARRNPGKVGYGSSGNGSAAHLTTQLLASLAQIQLVHVPYKGSAAALTDLKGGHIQLFFDAAVGLISPGKEGKVRLIGVASDKRLAMLPDVPTFIEQGIAGFTGSTWAGLLAPAGTPAAIVKRVADEVAAIVKLEDVRERLDTMGTIATGSTPAGFESFADETEKWGKVIREAKISAE